MKKVLGISILLVVVCALSWIIEPKFVSTYNLENIIHWTALYAIIGIGAALVIITGGIDLSIGSVVGMTGCLLAMILKDTHIPAFAAVCLVLLLAAALGFIHGILIAWMRLPSFIVTLCGMLIYRSLTRWITEDQALGFSNDHTILNAMAKGKILVPGLSGFALPIPFLIMVGLALAAGFFLNYTVYGRHLLALGSNEDAAKYSGIRTDRMTILAYVLCGLMSGIGGVLFAFYYNSMQPSAQGNSYELYAIAAAVLGGCSLRGGEGSILGVIVGTAVLRVLYNAINVLGIKTQLEFAIIGFVILAGVLADELVKRYAARRRAMGAA
ncbi:MAG: ABC transporter permease [Planctomycetota bacterium]